ncbi:serine/threonine protein kinase [Sphaeroforma arctica JP610]|uniref:Serine/threonine protein kinase n=1 Tax=Sphaeroforma arctica JP610 TaxID=667725 RepID=A0A0L0FM34_9EUKA|nr:serine/threonine protein kinase [Sphaeroforma arctica JP610]KNC77842.1 serine/threonine protein kinase [Sphaeroforma arctica JP610]|eukprot:XP_014151744.1 serine/threonine protein kinase [Sphaeroforma arctica JP610]
MTATAHYIWSLYAPCLSPSPTAHNDSTRSAAPAIELPSELREEEHQIMSQGVPAFHMSHDNISMTSSTSTLDSGSCETLDRYFQRTGQDDLSLRFRHVNQVQSGTTANIYRSVDLSNPDQYVACKVLKKSMASTRRFRKEEFLHRIVSSHPNIVDLYGTYESQGELTFVQEFCSRGELLDSIPLDQGLPEQHVIYYFAQIMAAVEFMHSVNVAHRDIKPENIVLTEDYTVKVVDFGEALDTTRTFNVGLAGTIPYISPEILDSHSRGESLTHTDFKSADVWSTGVVLFGMLTGRFPWNTATMDNSEFRLHTQGMHSAREAQRWGTFCPAVHALVNGLLAVDVSRRWTAKYAQQYIALTWPSVTGVKLEL